MEYVILAFCIINFGLLIFLLVKKNKVQIKSEENKLSKEQIEANAEIKAKIEHISKETMQAEIITLKDVLKEDNESSRRRLEEFERTINDRLQKQYSQLDETMNTRIKEIQEKVKTSIEGGFSDTSKAYKDLTEQLTLIGQTKKNIEELSGEVVSLKNVLENNQNRGKFGEFTLERIIYSIFGDAKDGVYAFQYKLKNYDESDRPDAVIFLPEPNNLLCIDSKFPFADYKGIVEAETQELREKSKNGFVQAVKKHITAVADKYIIKNTTAEYALLFIPSDAIFGYINAELDNVVEYARSKNVILTSPSTLQPILATINLVRLQYERKKNIDKIIVLINGLSNKFTSFTTTWDKLSERVRQLDDERNKLDKNVRNISDQFQKIENVSGFELETKDEN